jgi:hypothetical protein
MEQNRQGARLGTGGGEYAPATEAILMKRRQHGVNLDDGVALSTDEEFGLLFVNSRPEARSTLQGWLAEDDQKAMLFGGQIGTGKTTLLNEVLRAHLDALAIRIRFDTDYIDATEGGYVLLVLGQVLRACVDRGIDPSGCGITIGDFGALGLSDWGELSDALTNSPENLAVANQLRDMAAKMTPSAEHVRRSVGELLDRLTASVGRRPILVADGVDKFSPATADYFSLKDTLRFLGQHRTLFEVNAVHLFLEQDFSLGLPKLFIGGLSDETLMDVFGRRLGSYEPLFRDAFAMLTEYAGGNLRQGLRLLNAYYYWRTQKRNDPTAALALACHRVGSDLLSVPFGRFPADVAGVVKKDGYVEGSLLRDPKTAAGANEAVYRNWLFLDAEPSPVAPTRWPARINPLIDMAIDWKLATPPTPEEQAVRKWAHDHHVSPLGLNVPVDNSGEPDWDEFWKEIESSSSSEDQGLSILKLLEEIGAGLFGVERQDRIIVAYKKRGNLEAVRDFLVGKANTYGFFPCEEIALIGGEGRQPVQTLLTRLAKRDPHRIYSVDVMGDWTDGQLRDLEHRRDLFDNLQMLWWVQEKPLKRYLSFWQQLRQIFRIYRLEEELWRGITPEEIESDIEVITSLSSEKDPEGVRRLKVVLHFLHEQGGAA